jgi:FMN phosphatase YigB (HAD superfamily)
MSDRLALVFLVDLDNTLLDHDRLKVRIGEWLSSLPGAGDVALFWSLYEAVRTETGIVDLFETLRRYAVACDAGRIEGRLRADLLRLPLADLVYPHTVAALRHLGRIGLPVVLCDGHEPFQRHKLEVTGLAGYFDNRILVYDHKENHLGEVQSLYPAHHYVMIDDRPRIHAALRRALGQQVTTILVKQGVHGRSSAAPSEMRADMEIDDLGALLRFSAADLRALARVGAIERGVGLPPGTTDSVLRPVHPAVPRDSPSADAVRQ